MRASLHGHEEIVKLLLRNHALADQQDRVSVHTLRFIFTRKSLLMMFVV